MYKVRVQRLFNLGFQIQFYCRDRDAANEQMMWLQNVTKSGEKLTKKETSGIPRQGQQWKNLPAMQQFYIQWM